MQRLLRPLLLGLVVAGVVWGYRGLDLPRHMSVEGMRTLADAHAPWGPAIFMGIVVAAIFTHVPMMAHLLIAVGGVVFGLSACAYAWIAAMVGTTATFLLVRYVARDHVQRALSGRFARLRALDERLARHGFWTVLALRLVFLLAPPLNWELGLTGVRVPHYVAGTALGLIPGIAVTVFFADSIAPGGLVSMKVALSVLLVLAVVGTGSLVRRLLTSEQPAPPA
ncbi:MAG TPA: VTT domain-containing protein [Candidatus Binatus sp.]|nr:VTT domain-containing protein [Candidatus Binatus sp.]